MRTSLNALAQDTQARVAADRDEARRVGTRHSNDRLAGMQQALRVAEVVATLRLAPSAWPSR